MTSFHPQMQANNIDLFAIFGHMVSISQQRHTKCDLNHFTYDKIVLTRKKNVSF